MAIQSVYGFNAVGGAPTPIAGYMLAYGNSTTNRLEAIDDNGDRVPFDGDGPIDTINVVSTAGARTLDADDLKSFQVYDNTGNSTWTLPLANALQTGNCIGFRNNTTGTLTIDQSGSDEINGDLSGSIALTEGQTALVFSNGTDGWWTVVADPINGGSGGVSMPDQPESGNYTLQASDAGQTVAFTGSSEATFTFPAGSTYSDGDLINIVNNGSANLAIAPPSGTALYGYENDVQPVLKPGQSCTIMSNATAYRGLGETPKRFAITLAMINALSGMNDRVPVRDATSAMQVYTTGVSNGTAAAGTTTLQARLGYSGTYEQLLNFRDLQSTLDEVELKNAGVDAGNTIEARFTSTGGNLSAVTTMTRVEFELSGLI